VGRLRVVWLWESLCDLKLSVWGALGHRRLLSRVIFEDAELLGSFSKFPGSRNVPVDGVVLGQLVSEFFSRSVPLPPLHEDRIRGKKSFFRIRRSDLGAVNGGRSRDISLSNPVPRGTVGQQQPREPPLITPLPNNSNHYLFRIIVRSFRAFSAIYPALNKLLAIPSFSLRSGFWLTTCTRRSRIAVQHFFFLHNTTTSRNGLRWGWSERFFTADP